MNNKKLHILFLSGFLMSFSVFSQTKKELESQRKKFKSEIICKAIPFIIISLKNANAVKKWFIFHTLSLISFIIPITSVV